MTLLGYKLSHDFNERWQVLQNACYMDASAYQRNTYNAALAGQPHPGPQRLSHR